MRFKRIVLWSVVACTSFLSTAEAHSIYNTHVGQYLSINAGAAYANHVFFNGKSSSGFLSGGGGLYLGDQINRYFAPELAFQYFDLPPLGGAIILAINGKFTAAIGDRINLFTKLGIGFGEVRTCNLGCYKSDQMMPTFGLGVAYGLTPEWMLSTEVNGAYFPKSTNVNGVLGGLTVGATRYFNQ